MQEPRRISRAGIKLSTMSIPARPSTPVAQSTPSTPQPGKWTHPRMDEIVRRQNASTFSERNLTKVVYNVVGIGATWTSGNLLWKQYVQDLKSSNSLLIVSSLPNLFHRGKAFQPWADYTYHLLLCVFVFNILMACRPLLRKPDNVSDIPLTPAQRKLLGLPPSSAPPTPGSQYATPPKYPRSSTPLSGSGGNRGDFSNSPLSNKGSPLSGSINGSPFSPAASPLLQKAMGGALNGNRRHSYGSPSPLGPGVSRMNVPETPGTPSPSAAKGVNVGLNSRWLFEKGRRNSGQARLYT